MCVEQLVFAFQLHLRQIRHTLVTAAQRKKARVCKQKGKERSVISCLLCLERGWHTGDRTFVGGYHTPKACLGVGKLNLELCLGEKLVKFVRGEVVTDQRFF